MSTAKTKSKPSRLCGISSGDVLYRHKKWIASVRKQKQNLRAGAKMMVNTKTYETFFIHTIEIWCKARRQYLPLQMPDGGWSWNNIKDRDRVLKALETAVSV